MPAIHMTKAVLEALIPPEKGRARYQDTRLPGLVLVHWAGGGKVWFVYRKVARRPVEVRLGPWPDLSIENARKMATEVLAAMITGADPLKVTGRRAKGQTFGELFAWWRDTHARPRLRTWQGDVGIYSRYLAEPLGSKPVAAITKLELRAIHAAIAAAGKKRTANQVIELVRNVYNRAIRHDVYDGANPARAVELFPPVQRERRLTVAELPAFFAALEGASENVRAYVMLSLFTGARQANVLAMRWDEIDWQEGVWRIPRTKSGQSQTIPLEAAEIALLSARRAGAAGQSAWVLPGANPANHMKRPRKAWKAILKRAGWETGELRMHDLRRTHGSFLVDTGASMPIIGKSLGHTSPAATHIYARLSLDPLRAAKRAALESMMRPRD